MGKEFDEVRGRVLGTKPFPFISEVFPKVRHEESMQKVMLRSSTRDSVLVVRGSSNSKQGNKERPKFEHCQKMGHTKDECWDLHEKPSDYKPKQRSETAAATSTKDQFSNS